MSGGHYDYTQSRIRMVAQRIQVEMDDGQYDDYSEETRAKIAECQAALDIAAIMLERVDWLVSDDDSEDSFHSRWAAELAKK